MFSPIILVNRHVSQPPGGKKTRARLVMACRGQDPPNGLRLKGQVQKVFFSSTTSSSSSLIVVFLCIGAGETQCTGENAEPSVHAIQGRATQTNKPALRRYFNCALCVPITAVFKLSDANANHPFLVVLRLSLWPVHRKYFILRSLCSHNGSIQAVRRKCNHPFIVVVCLSLWNFFFFVIKTNQESFGICSIGLIMLFHRWSPVHHVQK